MTHQHNGPPSGVVPSEFDEAFWDERYRSTHRGRNEEPHPNLVAEVADLDPGSALDIGTGEGSDAIWLAERGWRVTAVDISPVALDLGRSRAEGLGGSTAQRIDGMANARS